MLFRLCIYYRKIKVKLKINCKIQDIPTIKNFANPVWDNHKYHNNFHNKDQIYLVQKYYYN